ncbi:hypothetical protein PanWU01x14_303450 [Parasponia andersonii]|uniref:Uncharacterized protein n=1 Tax=Parasponia andersonii TaxID=3476 RepID=A0A2P5ASY1_PARAD|nr:hypothetical protein PanWU01x14_303450 [Parasponia andersonii]
MPIFRRCSDEALPDIDEDRYRPAKRAQLWTITMPQVPPPESLKFAGNSRKILRLPKIDEKRCGFQSSLKNAADSSDVSS